MAFSPTVAKNDFPEKQQQQHSIHHPGRPLLKNNSANKKYELLICGSLKTAILWLI
jgi:hypothetical protein